MKIKLGKIVNYAAQKGEDFIKKAMAEFFGKTEVNPEIENFKLIQSLFNEWLIFEFKLSSETKIISDYYFKNPDNLSQNPLDELKQIIETQFFDMLELGKERKPGKWLMVYAFSTGKNYKVYEKLGSLNFPEKGIIYGRLAKINNRWYLVGSDPLYFSMTHTPRSKKLFLDQQISAKDIFPLLLPKEDKSTKKTSPRLLTKKEIKNKRKRIEKKFDKLIKKNNLETTFRQLLDFIYQENYKTNFADFYKDLSKIGIPEEIAFKKGQLFNDVWNFFPHKKLKGKSPAEIYKEKYGEG